MRNKHIEKIVLLSVVVLFAAPFRIKIGNHANKIASAVLYSPLFQEWFEHRNVPGRARMNDFSYCGFLNNETPFPIGEGLKVFDVTKAPYLATPGNKNDDDYNAIQAAIRDAEKAGGVVFLPPGVYDISVMTTNSLLIKGNPEGKPVILRGSTGGKVVLRMHTNDYTHAYDKKYDIKFSTPPVVQVGTGIHWRGESIDLAQRAPRGTSVLTFSKEVPWKPGDIIRIRSKNTAWEDTEKKLMGNASLALCSPLIPDPLWTRFGQTNGRLSLDIQIATVSGAVVTTRAPLPIGIEAVYPGSADLATTGTLRGFVTEESRNPTTMVGVENIAFEGLYHGSNIHHANNEADYLWNGLWYRGVAHCWGKNLSFQNLVNGVDIKHSYAVTVENVKFLPNTFHPNTTQYQGHFGANMSLSTFVLYRNLEFSGRYQHYVSFSANMVGGVYSGVKNTTTRHDDHGTIEQGLLDSHGWCFPGYILFENMENFAVHCGGNVADMPQSGHGVVFWNIGVGPWAEGSYFTPEFFQRTWANEEKNGWTKWDGYKLFPKSMLVHIHSEAGDQKMTIGGKEGDRDTEEIYIQGMNPPQPGIPTSVFEEQLKLRGEKK